MDGVEGSELGQVEGRRSLYNVLVEVDERDSREDASRPSDRDCADASGHLLHLDPGHPTRHPLRPGSQELPKGPRLGLWYDELHDGRGVEVQELPGHGLSAVFAELPESVAALRGDRPPRWGEIEEVSWGRPRPSRSDQPPEGGGGLIDRTKHGHRFAALGHLEALAARHPAQVPGQVLAELSHAHSVSSHVYTHGSIFGQTLAPLRRCEAVSESPRTSVSSEDDLT